MTVLARLAAAALLVPALAGTAFAEDATKDRDKARAELHQIAAEIGKLSHAFNLIHEIVAPSVVSIHTKGLYKLSNPFSGRSVTREVEAGEGSGFIFHSDAKSSWILTNSHVVLQTNHEQEFVRDANDRPVGYDKVVIGLNDNRNIEAEYVGYYLLSDLAVLKIPVPNMPTIEWADSDRAKVGDWVLALGFPLGVGYSATSGIISATDRSTGIYQSVGGFDSFIQTDAAINPGNSGGPLVDLEGQVVGINASIISRTGANIGLGFAIPSNLARRIAEDLLKFGKVSRPMVGVQIEDVAPDAAKALGLPPIQTVRIAEVVPGSPAATAGLVKDDIILSVNKAKVVSLQQFQARIWTSTRGEPITMHIWRAGAERDVPVVPVGDDELRGVLAKAAQQTAVQQGAPLGDYGLWLTTDDEPGLRITKVEDKGLADLAHLAVGDRLLHERTIGALRSLDDVERMAKRREITVQVSKDGRSYWLKLKRP
ncbi:MAG: trypsin-like peptidase domain-containing protein [Planctomycetes bacterium]|nr:trypsin-like peptidase domain-containing protein [Planctomycetota bacterium]